MCVVCFCVFLINWLSLFLSVDTGISPPMLNISCVMDFKHLFIYFKHLFLMFVADIIFQCFLLSFDFACSFDQARVYFLTQSSQLVSYFIWILNQNSSPVAASWEHLCMFSSCIISSFTFRCLMHLEPAYNVMVGLIFFHFK